MKIFGIGLSKTGTTSLAQALTLLGFKTRDYPGLTHYAPGDLSSIAPVLLEEHDALTDTPIPSFYRELDARYPDARFILTLRERQGWLNSCKKQFTQKLAEKQNEAHNRLFMDLYDCTVFDEEKFAAGYDRFVQGVLDHFRDRPGKLLTLNVTGGDGWEQLCPFLDRPIPDVPFPKANVTRIRWTKVEDLVAIVREAGQELARAHALLAGDGAADAPASGLRRLGDRLARGYLNLRGGRTHALDQAGRATHTFLVQRLTRLNPDIPVISRLAPVPPHQERGKWNHFWLVDPLDGEAGFAVPEGGFTVNIALIEDGKPLYGVVHAPDADLTYYATAGKQAYLARGDGTPQALTGDAPPAGPPTDPPSLALRLCLLARGQSLADTQEWHTAAAQVVVGALGWRLHSCGSQDDLKYNKPDLAQDCITLS
jgi:hypothetical protein